MLRVSTDHAVVEWAIPQTDLEWAVPLVTGRVTTTVQDRPLGVTGRTSSPHGACR